MHDYMKYAETTGLFLLDNNAFIMHTKYEMITAKQGNLLEMEYVYSWISSPTSQNFSLFLYC